MVVVWHPQIDALHCGSRRATALRAASICDSADVGRLGGSVARLGDVDTTDT
jgi:hypothetical protein